MADKRPFLDATITTDAAGNQQATITGVTPLTVQRQQGIAECLQKIDDAIHVLTEDADPNWRDRLRRQPALPSPRRE